MFHLILKISKTISFLNLWFLDMFRLNFTFLKFFI